MKHSASMSPARRLAEDFAALDVRITRLEEVARTKDVPADLETLVDESIAVATALMRAYATHAGKSLPGSDDPLDVFKAFVKSDPSLTAVRDNVRELVYYRNCLTADRADALPANPALMAVHTARHIYLYLYTRCAQEHRLP